MNAKAEIASNFKRRLLIDTIEIFNNNKVSLLIELYQVNMRMSRIQEPETLLA